MEKGLYFAVTKIGFTNFITTGIYVVILKIVHVCYHCLCFLNDSSIDTRLSMGDIEV